MPSPVFPEAPPHVEATSFEEVDKALNRLNSGKTAWLQLPPSKRMVLLRECLTDLMVLADEWIDKSCKAKGIKRGTSDEGEEWIGSFMPLIRNIRLLIETLKAKGKPSIPSVRTHKNGQLIATVFPKNTQEKLMLTGVKAEVWLEKGKPASQGKIYQSSQHQGKISLVLGAGNQGSIGPMDALHKLFVENEVVILKMNPVNDYLGQYIVRAFRALIEGNYLSIVYGGSEVGKYLCSHDEVDTIHITGSAKTHDAIVWGTEKQQEQKEKGERINQRHITSELGCVSPIIVVPGPWSDKDIDYQARQIVSIVTHNASFNCNGADVLVLPKGWNQSEKLLKRLEHHFGQKNARKAYYPGANERYQRFLENYPDAKVCGKQGEGIVPWTIAHNVPAKAGEFALNFEPFCGVLAITYIDAAEPKEFLSKVVPFCNDHIWGSLSTDILIHPVSQKQAEEELQTALSELKYGAIAVNCWNGLLYGLGSPSWGAYPGHTLEDIRSGRGIVHNTFLLDYPEKSIVYAPFRISPTPAWFYDNKNLISLGKALVNYEAKPSWLGLLSIIPRAFRG
jgi:acyl-CoA reductase-like NAD-dependent aldehyde dehydrogenase